MEKNPTLAEEMLFADRPLFNEDESVGGYLVRFAQENILFGIRGLARYANVEPSALLQMDRHRLANVLWGSGYEQRPDFELFRSAPVPVISATGKSRARMCPRCMAEDKRAYLRAKWDSPMQMYCERHKVMLIDTCSECGTAVDHLALPAIGRCPCGAELGKQKPEPIPTSVSAIRWVFAAMRAGSESARRVDEAPAAEALSRLAWHLDLEMEANPDRRRAAEPFVTTEVIRLVDPLFMDWPHGFVGAIAQFGWLPRELARKQTRCYLNAERFPELSEVLAALHKSGMSGRDGEGTGSTPETYARSLYLPAAFVPSPFPLLQKPQGAGTTATADSEEDANGDRLAAPDPEFVSPSAGLPTLLLIWLATQAVVTNSREVSVDVKQLGKFMKELGITFTSGGKTSPPQRTRQQLDLMLKIEFEVSGDRLLSRPRSSAPDAKVIGDHIDAGAPGLLAGSVVLSEWFFDQCLANPVALNKEHVRVLRAKRQSLSVYLWLRKTAAAGVRKATRTWQRFASDLGLEYSTKGKAKLNLGVALDRVIEVCPGITVNQTREGFSFAFTEAFMCGASAKPTLAPPEEMIRE